MKTTSSSQEKQSMDQEKAPTDQGKGPMDHLPQRQELEGKRIKGFGIFYPLVFWLHVAIVFAADFDPSKHPERMCQIYAAELEKTHQIPDKLLCAVSLTEAGRRTVGGLIAWPWTINIGGKGYYFPTKSAAIQAVRQYQKRGIKSIDVGCMQINLLHHPHAFTSLEKAFDPYTNISYGAKFLKELQKYHKNWPRTIAHYHSARPVHHIPYRKKVFKKWFEEKRKGRNPLLKKALWGSSRSSRPFAKPKARTFLPPSPSPSSPPPSSFANVRRVRRSALLSYRAPFQRVTHFSPSRTSPRRVTPPLPVSPRKVTPPLPARQTNAPQKSALKKEGR